jgi:hypothetical protein
VFINSLGVHQQSFQVFLDHTASCMQTDYNRALLALWVDVILSDILSYCFLLYLLSSVDTRILSIVRVIFVPRSQLLIETGEREREIRVRIVHSNSRESTKKRHDHLVLWLGFREYCCYRAISLFSKKLLTIMVSDEECLLTWKSLTTEVCACFLL